MQQITRFPVGRFDVAATLRMRIPWLPCLLVAGVVTTGCTHRSADLDGDPVVHRASAALHKEPNWVAFEPPFGPDTPEPSYLAYSAAWTNPIGMGNGHAESWDGRLFIANKGGWCLNVFRPEAVKRGSPHGRPDFSDAFGQNHLIAPNVVDSEPENEHQKTGMEGKNALAVIPNPDRLGDNPYACVCELDTNSPTEFDCQDNVDGTYRCYDMVIFANEVDLSYDNNGKIVATNASASRIGRLELKVAIDNPTTVGADLVEYHWERQFQPLTRADSNEFIHGIEPTVTADGRLLVFNRVTPPNHPEGGGNEIKYILNEGQTPAGASGWTDPKPISSLFDDTTLVDERTVQERYPLARGQLRKGNGEFYAAGERVGGAYPWISLSGEELVHPAGRVNYEDTPGHFEHNPRAGLAVVGPRTGFTYRHIDGALNPNRHAMNGGHRFFTSSPGATNSFWPPYAGVPSLLPYLSERPVLPLWVSNAIRTYDEVSYRHFMDPHTLLFLPMNEVLKGHDPSDYLDHGFDETKTADVSSGGHIGLLENHQGHSTPIPQFPLDYYRAQCPLDSHDCVKSKDNSLLGAHGNAILFPWAGRVRVPHENPREPGKTLALDPEGSMSLHLFFKPLVHPEYSRVIVNKGSGTGCAFRLIQMPNGGIRAIVWTKNPLDSTTEQLEAVYSAPLSVGQIDNAGGWTAVGFTYDRVTKTLRLYINGEAVLLDDDAVGTNHWPVNDNDGDLLIGPAGMGDEPSPIDASQPLMMIDEVSFSKVARTPLEMAREARRRVLTTLPLGLNVADVVRDLPQPEDNPEVVLGKNLFNDVRLSANADLVTNKGISCASCHDEAKSFTDQLETPPDPPFNVSRNTPTVLNSAFQLSLMWDGRSASLEQQWRLPVSSPDEMGSNVGYVTNAIRGPYGIDDYNQVFTDLYGQTATQYSIGRALATYQRSLVRAESPADLYDAGDEDALDDTEENGRAIFFGRGRCVACHHGSNYSDGNFHRTGLANDRADAGTWVVPLKVRGAFKTPSLRNVDCTAPYFHDGSANWLPEVVRRYNNGVFHGSHGQADPQRSVEIKPLGLSAAEQNALVQFLKALTSIHGCP